MMHQPARAAQPCRLDPTFLLAFLLPVFAWASLTLPGYFVLRSGFLPIFNLVDRLAHLGDLAWSPTIGAGYHPLGGEGWLPYSLAALPAMLGAVPADAVKWIFALAFIAGSVGAYLWARRRLLDGWPALVAASAYVFSPLWLTVVYTRGALAEAVLLSLLPWVLWAADAVFQFGDRKRPERTFPQAGPFPQEGAQSKDAFGRQTKVRRAAAVIILALLAAACLWAHLALGLASLVMILLYLLILRATGRSSSRQLGRAGLGLLLGAALGALGLLPLVLRSSLGEAHSLELWQWSILLSPWLALFAGWIAARLAAMLTEQDDAARAPLFASLIALALLGVYATVQPVASMSAIPPRPLAIFGENEIALLSVEIEGTPRPGDTVALNVEWQALKPLTQDYTVFFHVIAKDDQRYGQLDTMPQAGALPTTRWQPGEVIHDRYEAVLSPDAPLGSDYRYWLGWYLNLTGERLAQGQTLASGQDDKYVVTP